MLILSKLYVSGTISPLSRPFGVEVEHGALPPAVRTAMRDHQ